MTPEEKSLKLKKFIKSKFLTESELAKELGWSKQRLCHTTTFKKGTTLKTLVELAGVLGVTPGYLLDNYFL